VIDISGGATPDAYQVGSVGEQSALSGKVRWPNDGGQIAGWELTGVAGLSEDESHGQTPLSQDRIQAADRSRGEPLHALAKRYDLSRNMIRIWVKKLEAGALDEDAHAADLLQDYEAKIAALERMVGRQALEIEFLKGALKTHRGREAGVHPSSPAPWPLRRPRMPG
jgi:hypothetical protein